MFEVIGILKWHYRYMKILKVSPRNDRNLEIQILGIGSSSLPAVSAVYFLQASFKDLQNGGLKYLNFVYPIYLSVVLLERR